MPHFLSQLKDKVVDKVTERLGHTSLNDHGPSSGAGPSGSNNYNTNPAAPPPAWAPAPEVPHQFGLYSDAPTNEFEDAERFIAANPVHAPRLLSSKLVEHLNVVGGSAWGIEHPDTSRFSGQITNIDGVATGPGAPTRETPRFLHYTNPNYSTAYEARLDAMGGYRKKDSAFSGVVKIETYRDCKDVCLLSDLPIMAGLYDIQGKRGVYYEVKVIKMRGAVAVGTSCRPYPVYRLPGWNRLSAGFHLDDYRKFFEDPDGGRDYVTSTSSLSNPTMPFISSPLPAGSIIGCGYEFATGALFYTYQGLRLPSAFTGLYMPRTKYDVFAAIGVMGENTVEINFGADMFAWKEANEWQWKVEGHLGRMAPPQNEPPPPFAAVDPAFAPPPVRQVVSEETGIAPPPSFPSPSFSRPTEPPPTAARPRDPSPERAPPPTDYRPPATESPSRPRQDWGYDDDDDYDESRRRTQREDEARPAASSGEDNRHLFAPPPGVTMQSKYDNYGYNDD